MLTRASSLGHHHRFHCQQRCSAVRRSRACAAWSVLWRATVAGAVAGFTIAAVPIVVVQMIVAIVSGPLFSMLSLIIAPIAVGLVLLVARVITRGRVRRLLGDERVVRSAQVATLLAVLLQDGLGDWDVIVGVGVTFAVPGTIVGLICGVVLAIWIAVVERSEPSATPDALVERARMVAFCTAIFAPVVLLTVLLSPVIWLFIVPLILVGFGAGAAWAATPCIVAGVVTQRWPDARTHLR